MRIRDREGIIEMMRYREVILPKIIDREGIMTMARIRDKEGIIERIRYREGYLNLEGIMMRIRDRE